MAVPAYATDLVDITTSFSLNWNLASEGGGGQNAITAPETDDFIQGTESVSRNPWSSSVRGVLYDRAAITVAASDAVFVWWKADVAAALDTIVGGGVRLCVGATLTDYKQFYVAGSNTYALGGWRCNPVDPALGGDLNRGTPGAAPYDTFGVMFDLPATGPSKGFPFKCDMIRHGREINVTAGEIANPATWALLATQADLTANRWGIVQGTNTGAALQGVVNWGTAAALVYSRDANRSIVLADTLGFVIPGFTQINFNNASTDLEWTNISVIALGTANRGTVTVNNNALVSFFGCAFNDINTTADGGTNSTWDGTTWRRCNAVTAAGGSFLDCSVLASTVALDTSAFVYNLAANPTGILDGMTFTQGAAAHHAIEFGLTSPTAISLNNMTFTDFDADASNGAALHFLRTTGTVTVTLSGTSTPTFKTAGATIVFVTGAVTVTATTLDSSGTVVPSCRVYLRAASGVGTLPVNASVTIANSGTTATVTHTGHGLVTGDKVSITGAIGAGGGGSYPVVEASLVEAPSGNGTTHDVAMPAGVVAGELLMVFQSVDGAGAVSMVTSGWTERQSLTIDGAAVFGVYSKTADGTETTFQTSTVATEADTAISLRISGWTSLEVDAGATGTGTVGTSEMDAPSFSPTGGSKDYLWIAACGWDQSVGVVGTFPTGYTGGLDSADGVDTASAGTAVSFKTATAPSEDPSATIIDDPEQWRALVVAVAGSAGGVPANNGVYVVTVTDANTYTYTMSTAPDSSPTGTITSTFLFLEGVSDAVTGIISMTRAVGASQSVSGWARKSSSADSPRYKQGPLAGTVSSTTGASFLAVMIPDE